MKSAPLLIESSIESSSKPKNPFRAAESRNDKPHQHRYERRKVRQVLRMADTGPEEF
jgi:hypothetical protein